MELKKEINSPIELFNQRFYKKNKKYTVRSTMTGQIIQIKTEDKDIIEFCKKLGLT